jgi:hypothetical protein
MPFVPEHLRTDAVGRLACAAATPEDVQRAAALTSAVAREGGRMLLCVPDGSPASAAAKRVSDRLERCVTVGLPRDGSAARLLLRKFRPDVVIGFRDTADAPTARDIIAAARDLRIPLRLVARDESNAELLAPVRAGASAPTRA